MLVIAAYRETVWLSCTVCYRTAHLLYIAGYNCLQRDCNLQFVTVQHIYCILLLIAAYRETVLLSCTVCYRTAHLLYIADGNSLKRDSHIHCVTVQHIYCVLLVIAAYRVTEWLSCTVFYRTAYLMYIAGYSCLQRERLTVIYTVLPYRSFTEYCWWELLTERQSGSHVQCVTLQHIYCILLVISAYREAEWLSCTVCYRTEHLL
jgi:predicted neutral ceramidase superfamily lipid hydrolase